MTKYFFSNNCYWQSDTEKVYRENSEINLTPLQTKALSALIQNNGRYLKREELFLKVYGREMDDNESDKLSNLFTRKKANDKGILEKIVELKDNGCYIHSRSEGYKIDIPRGNIKNSKISANYNESFDDWEYNTDFERYEKELITDDKINKFMTSFLKGTPPRWNLIFSKSENKPVRREIVDIIKQEMNEESIIVLTGAGGEGKTTAIMQLCYELYCERRQVFYHSSYSNNYIIPSIADDDSVFIVDNPSNSYKFTRFISRAYSLGITVIIASRSNEWNLLTEELNGDICRSIKEIHLNKISHFEAQLFTKCVRINLETNKNENELLSLFEKQSYGFLYSSMLMIVYGSNSLEVIAKQIIEHISTNEVYPNLIFVLASIVLSEYCGFFVDYKCYNYICDHLWNSRSDAKKYLSKELVKNGEFFQTRHSKISELFYKFLFTEGDWSAFIGYDEKKIIYSTLMDFYLSEVKKLNPETCNSSIYASNLVKLLVKSQDIISNDDIEEYNHIVQRLIEECCDRASVIDRIYNNSTNDKMKEIIADKSYARDLPTFHLYYKWLKKDIDSSSTSEEKDIIRTKLKHLCYEIESSSNLFSLYAYAEELWGNIGDYDTPYSAAWTYLEATKIISTINDQSFWQKWVKFIRKHSNIDNKNKYTIHAILKEICMENTCNSPSLWAFWADEEQEIDNIGDYDTPYSATWIYFEATKKFNAIVDPSFWNKLIKFVRNYPAINNNKLLYICDELKKVCINNLNNTSEFWINWADLSEIIGNIGNYDTPYSAAWIYVETTKRVYIIDNPSFWRKWIQFIDNHPNIDNKGIYSISNIYIKACINNMSKSSLLWTEWAMYEVERGNIGNKDAEYTATWIFIEAVNRFKKSSHAKVWLEYAKFVQKYPVTMDGVTITPQSIICKFKEETNYDSSLCPEFKNFEESLGM